MNKTPLYDEHKALGARMVDFAGWQLPVMYSSVMDEHNATRSCAGLFDVSHMGEITITGTGATDTLRRILPTALDRLRPGFSLYSCLCNESGGVIDDLFVFMTGHDAFYLVVNAATREKDADWLRRQVRGSAVVEDLSADTAKIDLQGPRSADILLQVLSDDRLQGLERFHFIQDVVWQGREIMVSNTGYTGEKGYELYAPNDLAAPLWKALLEAGAGPGIRPAGLGARNTLRLDACYSLYGHELSEDITPVEAGLSWLVSSGDDFIGCDVLRSQKKSGAPRKTVCFKMQGRAVPRDGYEVERNGSAIGRVTSGSFSPTFKCGIGMALVEAGSARAGDEIEIVVRSRRERAEVVKRPLYAYAG